MKRRIIALLLALMTVLGVFPVTALAAATVPDALGEVDIYHSGEKMDYLSINGQARSQTYTYYNYKAPDGSTKQIPAYCVNPNTAGVPRQGHRPQGHRHCRQRLPTPYPGRAGPEQSPGGVLRH